MRDLVVWTGPVNLTQVAGATMYPDPLPPLEVSYGCLGDRSPHCNDVSMQLSSQGGGSILEGMARGAGSPLGSLRDVFVGSFSAGGSVVSNMLKNASDASRVRAVLLSDSTYSAIWVDASKRIPYVSPSVVDFGVRCAGGSPQLFVATASPSPNFNYATGVEVLGEIRRQIELKGGVSFNRVGFGITPGPVNAYRCGNVLFAEYPMEPLGHGHPKIAPQVWQSILWPWVREQRGETSVGSGAIAAAVGAIAGFATGKVLL